MVFLADFVSSINYLYFALRIYNAKCNTSVKVMQLMEIVIRRKLLAKKNRNQSIKYNTQSAKISCNSPLCLKKCVTLTIRSLLTEESKTSTISYFSSINLRIYWINLDIFKAQLIKFKLNRF